mgnify:CR=1 FL=1
MGLCKCKIIRLQFVGKIEYWEKLKDTRDGEDTQGTDIVFPAISLVEQEEEKSSNFVLF